MSDQAPPPPPESNDPAASAPPPPPPPPSQPSAYPPPAAPASSSAGMNSDELKAAVQGANPFDLGQIGLGVLVFIASLLPYYTVSAEVFGAKYSDSVTAWHGFFGWFGVLLALGAAGVLVAALFLNVAIPSMRMTVLGLWGGAVLCTVLALFVFPGSDIDGLGVDTGHGFGYWLALLCVLGGGALAFLRFQNDD